MKNNKVLFGAASIIALLAINKKNTPVKRTVNDKLLLTVSDESAVPDRMSGYGAKNWRNRL